MNEAHVTVLMPVYNAAAYLRESIESILAQTFTNFEFLIIDDGSADSSAEIIRSYDDPRIRFIQSDSNQGMVATLNQGLQLASCELIARQDADDIAYPNRLHAQVTLFEERPELALVGGQCVEIDERGKTRLPTIQKPTDLYSIRWFSFFDNPFIHTSTMYRRSVVRDTLGGYKISDWCSDYDLWSHLLYRYPVANLSDRVVYYRSHSESLIGSLKSDKNYKSISLCENAAIIHNNLKAVIGPDQFTHEDAVLLRGTVEGVSREAAGRYQSLMTELRESFLAVYPEARRSENLPKIISAQLANVASTLFSHSRYWGWRLMIEAIRISPASLSQMPWKRAIFLTLFGEGAARFIRRLLKPRA